MLKSIGGPAATAVALACITAPGCTKPIDADRRATTVRVSSSGLAGQLVVGSFSQLADVSVHSVRVSGGSPSIVDALREGDLDVGLATADVAYLAFAGQLDESIPAFDQLRGMAVLGLNTLHLIVGKDKRAQSVADLRGFNIALGSGSGTALVANLLLDASGLSLSDVHRDPLPYAEAANRLATGELDAAFMTIVPPGDPVVVATRAGARVLEIQGAVVERLRLQHPFLINTIIPRGSYPGQTTPIRTIGVDLLLVCRADLDEGLVYRLVDTYFAVLERSIPAIDFDRAPATSIPLHPGAARYYRQRELSR